MSDGGDNALLELFRDEVRANVQILNEGLVALEQDTSNVRDIEPLMRAAHSIKGAARVVNIDAAVTVAHAAEDCLVAAQEGRITLDTHDIDRLLNAADLLAGLAEAAGPNLPQWLTQSQPELDQLSAALTDRARGQTVTPDESAPTESAPTEQAPAEGATAENVPAETTQDRPQLTAAIQADQTHDFSPSPMLDLFRSETESHGQTLQTALRDLQPGPVRAEDVARLSRAAQSIRSAARLVQVRVAGELAGAIEERLDAIQQRGRIDPSENLNALAQLATSLVEIAGVVGPEYRAWLSEQAHVLAERLEDLHAALSRVVPESDAVTNEVQPATEPIAPAEPQPAEPQPAGSQPAGSLVTPASHETGTASEQVVRVTAQSLTRLMALAGESLVEARWLQPFAQSLLELKRQQALLSDKLEQLRQWLPAGDVGDRRVQLLAEAGDRLRECREMLGTQISEFEKRARNADDLNSRLYNEVIASRMRPFRDGVQGFPRMVRDLSRELSKKVAFRILGEKTDVDRDILEKLDAPLNHILRNALDHGLETPQEREAAGKRAKATLEIEARHNAGMLVITVRDDGRGIDLEKIRRRVIDRGLADAQIARNLNDAELLEFLFLPTFSTADGVTEVSGRGVGLDVVHSMVHGVGGTVRVSTQLGQGTTFQLELPITMSVIRAVLVKIAGEPYAFPHNRIDRLVRFSQSELHSLEDRQYFETDGTNVGIVRASRLLELDTLPLTETGNEPADAARAVDEDECDVILFSHLSDSYGLIVDEFCGERDLVVRPLDPRLGKVPDINAAAILDDGSPVLIVDLDDLRRSIERKLHHDAIGRAGTRLEQREAAAAKRILVVDDSITVREVQRQLLTNQGYEVEVAVDGIEGWNTLSRRSFDLVITDVDMPRLNGIDLVRRIKSDEQLRSVPVVIVSYKDREQDRVRGMNAGADYYLTKSSFHDETLLDAVQDLIGAARS